MSSAKTKSRAAGAATINQPLEDSNAVQHAKPKRKAPARPGMRNDEKSNKTAGTNSNAKVKRKTSTSSLKDEGTKAKRKVSTNSIKEESEGGDDFKDNKLRRIVSPRKEQYSHLLDEMVGCGDMVLLEPLTEENIIENLKTRYAAGDIYTYIGPVVVSINPYRPLQIYTSEFVEEYRSRIMYEMPPHIFAVTDQGYRSMRDLNLDQCIIISGESGAGKTEASKLVMQYVAQVSGKGEEVDRVKEQLLQSNPVLEAFGNAKTKRNDNSSRFGKYMDIEFDYKGDPMGGLISNYLLEKSRVVSQAEGERNFHIFYQLLAGAPADVLQMLHLERDVSKYSYLNVNKLAAVDDKEQFNVTVNAMEVIGFVPDEISSILELLAAILNLGNVTFSSYTLPNSIDACNMDNAQSATFACDMLGCSLELMEECLTKRSVETKTDYVMKPLSAGDAVYARDALCKAIYDRLFDWLVNRINDRIKATVGGKRKVIGVLDIYGFEVFEQNSFEQFIINYCNEKLQQVFIELTLMLEQEEYEREGIAWEHIDYFNNAVICELIEHPNKGMLAYLDEECLRPGQATDDTLLHKFNQRCLNHAHYESRASKHLLSDKTLQKDQFRLIHYAGKVTYTIEGFLEKNKDLLFKDLSQAMYACERKLLKELFPEGDPDRQTKKRPHTTGYQFRTSVAELMKNLLSKNPNYIRCIKPNDNQQPNNFDAPLVRHQVAYLGLFENVRVRRAGFAFRQDYKQALDRYKMLCDRTWPNWRGRPKDGIREILKACGKVKSDFSCGRSKIFIRNPITVFDLEGRRKKRLNDLAILVQKTYRGWHHWNRFQQLRKAQITIAKHLRCFLARRWFLSILNATIVIQSYYRGWVARERVRRMRYIARATWAAGIIRKYFYGWQARKMVWEMRYRARVESSVVVIQKYYRGWRVRYYYRAETAAIVIQKYFRGWWVRHFMEKERAAIVLQKYFRGWKARCETRALFKKVAAPKIADFIWRVLCYRYLLKLKRNLPSKSPLDRRWPKPSSFLFEDTSEILRPMYHKWRCKKVRDYYINNPKERRRLNEKSRASLLFKGKKSLYPQSVSVPFQVDRLNLRSDDRWSRIVAQTNEQRIIWADHALKINRKDAKGIPVVLVVTGVSMMVLDPKNLAMKYRIELQYLKQLSMSTFSDHLFVVHIDPYKATDRAYTKGDFIFRNPNIVEMVTKIHSVIQESHSRKLKIVFSNEIRANFKIDEAPCIIHFQHDARSGGRSRSPICRRKGNDIQIIV